MKWNCTISNVQLYDVTLRLLLLRTTVMPMSNGSNIALEWKDLYSKLYNLHKKQL